jgi:hypothetical protein
MNNLLGLSASNICLTLGVGVAAAYPLRKSFGKWICAHDKIAITPSKTERVVQWIKEVILSRKPPAIPSSFERTSTIAARAGIVLGGTILAHLAGHAVTRSLFMTISHLNASANNRPFFPILKIDGQCFSYYFNPLNGTDLYSTTVLGKEECRIPYKDCLGSYILA